MADFCTNCTTELFNNDVNIEPDIDIEELFSRLEPGSFLSCLCEGCELRGIANRNGVMTGMYLGHDGKIVYIPYEIKASD